MDTIYSMHNISYQQVVQLETIIRTIIMISFLVHKPKLLSKNY